MAITSSSIFDLKDGVRLSCTATLEGSYVPPEALIELPSERVVVSPTLITLLIKPPAGAVVTVPGASLTLIDDETRYEYKYTALLVGQYFYRFEFAEPIGAAEERTFDIRASKFY